MIDEPTTEDVLRDQEAQQPVASEWSMAQPLTKANRAQWINKVGQYAVETGKSQRAIGQHFGMSQGVVSKYLTEFWKTVTLPQAEEHRKREISIVDDLLDTWLPSAKNLDKDALAAAVKLLDRRAKLTGSDSPVKIDAQVVEVTAAERELQELLAQEERDQKVRAESNEEIK